MQVAAIFLFDHLLSNFFQMVGVMMVLNVLILFSVTLIGD